VTFAAAIAAAADSQPHARPDKVHGRVLLADGDGLAYYCAGNDDTPSGLARRNLETKIEGAMRAAGASSVLILTTSRASHKGHRFAIATVKPYQGKRDSGRRPKNWQFLRELIERDQRALVTETLEADDLFAVHSARLGDEHVAILTEDKDMRMVPGWHLHWDDHRLVRVQPDTWAFEANGKLFGRKWFWTQMLQGDGIDNIPGLPYFTDGSILKSGANKGQIKQIKCGEETAPKLLADCANEQDALRTVADLYRSCYGDAWLVQMLEQACLLWMRRTDRLFDCCAHGGPLAELAGSHELNEAMQAVRSRVVDL
jgi:hypothetical protein